MSNGTIDIEINDVISDTPAPTQDAPDDGGAPPADGAPPAEASQEGVKPSSTPPVAEPPKKEEVPPVASAAGDAGVPPPETPPALTREQELERDNALLRAEVLKFSDKVMGVEPRPATPPVVQPAVQRQPQMLNFIKDDAMFDETMKSAENMNALLTVVVNTAVENAQRVVPALVAQMVNHQVTLKTATVEFYRKNADLLPHRSFVGFVANEVTAAHPDWDLEKVMDETEKETRRRLILHQTASGQVSQDGSSVASPDARRPGPAGPAFVPRGGGRRGPNDGGSMTAVEKEINDLIS